MSFSPPRHHPHLPPPNFANPSSPIPPQQLSSTSSPSLSSSNSPASLPSVTQLMQRQNSDKRNPNISPSMSSSSSPSSPPPSLPPIDVKNDQEFPPLSQTNINHSSSQNKAKTQSQQNNPPNPNPITANTPNSILQTQTHTQNASSASPTQSQTESSSSSSSFRAPSSYDYFPPVEDQIPFTPSHSQTQSTEENMEGRASATASFSLSNSTDNLTPTPTHSPIPTPSPISVHSPSPSSSPSPTVNNRHQPFQTSPPPSRPRDNYNIDDDEDANNFVEMHNKDLNDINSSFLTPSPLHTHVNPTSHPSSQRPNQENHSNMNTVHPFATPTRPSSSDPFNSMAMNIVSPGIVNPNHLHHLPNHSQAPPSSSSPSPPSPKSRLFHVLNSMSTMSYEDFDEFSKQFLQWEWTKMQEKEKKIQQNHQLSLSAASSLSNHSRSSSSSSSTSSIPSLSTHSSSSSTFSSSSLPTSFSSPSLSSLPSSASSLSSPNPSIPHVLEPALLSTLQSHLSTLSTHLNSPRHSPARDWNSEFQQLMHTLQQDETIHNLEDEFIKLSELAEDFVFTAKTIGRIIISESHLDDEFKTIQPSYYMGQGAGGMKLICHNIVFKFAINGKLDLYGNDENAALTAGHELLGLSSYYRAILSLRECPFHVPLACLIDYRGYRLIAESKLPIDKSTLLIGSHDGGRTIFNMDPTLTREMRVIASMLNLKGHYTANTNNNQNTFLYSCFDLEIHRGKDNKIYLLDFHRSFPPEPPNNVFVSEMKAMMKITEDEEEKKREKGITTRTFPSPSSSSYLRNTHLYRLLRPELVRSSPVPLSPDAFSSADRDQSSRIDVESVYNSLFTAIIPSFAKHLDEIPSLELLDNLSSLQENLMSNIIDNSTTVALNMDATSNDDFNGQMNKQIFREREREREKEKEKEKDKNREKDYHKEKEKEKDRESKEKEKEPKSVIPSTSLSSSTSASSSLLTSYLHQSGINIRYLGVVRSHLVSPLWREELLVEMLSRVLKNEFRSRMRNEMKSKKYMSSSPYRRIAVDFVNLVFYNSQESTEFWNQFIKPKMIMKFPRALQGEELQNHYQLKFALLPPYYFQHHIHPYGNHQYHQRAVSGGATTTHSSPSKIHTLISDNQSNITSSSSSPSPTISRSPSFSRSQSSSPPYSQISSTSIPLFYPPPPTRDLLRLLFLRFVNVVGISLDDSVIDLNSHHQYGQNHNGNGKKIHNHNMDMPSLVGARASSSPQPSTSTGNETTAENSNPSNDHHDNDSLLSSSSPSPAVPSYPLPLSSPIPLRSPSTPSTANGNGNINGEIIQRVKSPSLTSVLPPVPINVNYHNNTGHHINVPDPSTISRSSSLSPPPPSSPTPSTSSSSSISPSPSPIPSSSSSSLPFRFLFFDRPMEDVHLVDLTERVKQVNIVSYCEGTALLCKSSSKRFGLKGTSMIHYYAKLAESKFREALRYSLDDYLTLCNFSMLYSIVYKDRTKAKSFLLRALFSNHNHQRSWYYLAQLFHYEYNDQNKAQLCYLRALLLNGKHSNTLKDYGNLLRFGYKDDEKAKKMYTACLENQPNHIKALVALGGIISDKAQNIEEFTEVIDIYKRAALSTYGDIKSRHQSQDTYLKLLRVRAEIAAYHGDFVMADALFNDALSYRPVAVLPFQRKQEMEEGIDRIFPSADLLFSYANYLSKYPKDMIKAKEMYLECIRTALKKGETTEGKEQQSMSNNATSSSSSSLSPMIPSMNTILFVMGKSQTTLENQRRAVIQSTSATAAGSNNNANVNSANNSNKGTPMNTPQRSPSSASPISSSPTVPPVHPQSHRSPSISYNYAQLDSNDFFASALATAGTGGTEGGEGENGNVTVDGDSSNGNVGSEEWKTQTPTKTNNGNGNPLHINIPSTPNPSSTSASPSSSSSSSSSARRVLSSSQSIVSQWSNVRRWESDGPPVSSSARPALTLASSLPRKRQNNNLSNKTLNSSSSSSSISNNHNASVPSTPSLLASLSSSVRVDIPQEDSTTDPSITSLYPFPSSHPPTLTPHETNTPIASSSSSSTSTMSSFSLSDSSTVFSDHSSSSSPLTNSLLSSSSLIDSRYYLHFAHHLNSMKDNIQAELHYQYAIDCSPPDGFTLSDNRSEIADFLLREGREIDALKYYDLSVEGGKDRVSIDSYIKFGFYLIRRGGEKEKERGEAMLSLAMKLLEEEKKERERKRDEEWQKKSYNNKFIPNGYKNYNKDKDSTTVAYSNDSSSTFPLTDSSTRSYRNAEHIIAESSKFIGSTGEFSRDKEQHWDSKWRKELVEKFQKEKRDKEEKEKEKENNKAINANSPSNSNSKGNNNNIGPNVSSSTDVSPSSSSSSSLPYFSYFSLLPNDCWRVHNGFSCVCGDIGIVLKLVKLAAKKDNFLTEKQKSKISGGRNWRDVALGGIENNNNNNNNNIVSTSNFNYNSGGYNYNNSYNSNKGKGYNNNAKRPSHSNKASEWKSVESKQKKSPLTDENRSNANENFSSNKTWKSSIPSSSSSSSKQITRPGSRYALIASSSPIQSPTQGTIPMKPNANIDVPSLSLGDSHTQPTQSNNSSVIESPSSSSSALSSIINNSNSTSASTSSSSSASTSTSNPPAKTWAVIASKAGSTPVSAPLTLSSSSSSSLSSSSLALSSPSSSSSSLKILNPSSSSSSIPSFTIPSLSSSSSNSSSSSFSSSSFIIPSLPPSSSSRPPSATTPSSSKSSSYSNNIPTSTIGGIGATSIPSTSTLNRPPSNPSSSTSSPHHLPAPSSAFNVPPLPLNIGNTTPSNRMALNSNNNINSSRWSTSSSSSTSSSTSSPSASSSSSPSLSAMPSPPHDKRK